MVAIAEHVKIREQYELPNNIDVDNCIIRDVKVCGIRSRNNRLYPRETLQEALHFYEGAFVYFNAHPKTETTERDPATKIGWLQNCRVTESGVFGDLHLLESHEHTARVLEAAQKNPSLFSLSHDASGDLSSADENGYKTVLRITEVWAVDMVDRGGTNESLFEADMSKTTLRRLIEEMPGEHNSHRLLEMDDPSGILDAEMDVAEMGEDDIADEGEDKSWEDHLLAAIGALIKSPDYSEDVHKKAEELLGMLKPDAPETDFDTEDDITEEDDDADDDYGDDKEMTESQVRKKYRRLLEAHQKSELKDWIREEISKKQVKQTPRLVEHLCAMKDKTLISEHLDDLKETLRESGPRSSAGILPEVKTKNVTPANTDDFAANYRKRNRV